MAITQFDKATCRMLGQQLEKTLRAFAADYGLTVQSAGGRFTDLEFTSKVLFKVNNPELQTNAAREEWNRYCELFDLKPEDFGREFTAKDGTYRVSGIALNRSKFPVKATDAAGKVMLFTADGVRRQLHK